MEFSSDRPRRHAGLWIKLLVALAVLFTFFLVSNGGDVVQAASFTLYGGAFLAGCAGAIALPYVIASRAGAFTYPEAERFPTPEQRDRAFQDAVPGVAPLLFAPTAMLAVCVAAMFRINSPSSGVKEPWTTVIFFVLFFAVFWSVLPLMLFRRRRMRAILRRHLCAAGIPTCLRCGYDLRGLNETGRCPECGAAFEFQRDSK